MTKRVRKLWLQFYALLTTLSQMSNLQYVRRVCLELKC